MNEKLFNYISECATAYQAIGHTCDILDKAGYTHLSESSDWALEAGKGYYVTRNGSTLIAFRIPAKTFRGFMITAAHCDAPGLKIKENAEMATDKYVRLTIEDYGGPVSSTWLDRPLSVAGRLIVRTETGIRSVLVDMKDPCVLIPNVAPHVNRAAKDGSGYNMAVDMVPLYRDGEGKGSFRAMIAEKAGVSVDDIVSTDLFVYNPQPGIEWGDFISCPRLDDLQCSFASLTAFLQAKDAESVPVCCIFDNEEVGSRTKQGAAGTFMKDVLRRISQCFGHNSTQYRQLVANSFMVSCDNAHAVHPNHPELADKNHSVYMNGGVVIKYNASQSYTSDAVSSGLFRMICEEAGVPTQMYANRADIRGGGTLGNVANTQVSLNTVDIGAPQLAMHSTYETSGKKDTEYMVKALTHFFEKSLIMEADGVYTLK